MRDLRELYQDVIIDHNRTPHNYHALDNANRVIEGFNPLCGDKLKLYLRIENNIIQEASFEGAGCAISTASASLMTDQIKHKTIAEAEQIFNDFHLLLTQETATVTPRLGKLAVLGGVREFPARVKCATLAWHALQAALHDEHTVVSTE
jgi:nitrogen fixation NifU-like protein